MLTVPFNAAASAHTLYPHCGGSALQDAVVCVLSCSDAILAYIAKLLAWLGRVPSAVSYTDSCRLLKEHQEHLQRHQIHVVLGHFSPLPFAFLFLFAWFGFFPGNYSAKDKRGGEDFWYSESMLLVSRTASAGQMRCLCWYLWFPSQS